MHFNNLGMKNMLGSHDSKIWIKTILYKYIHLHKEYTS